MLHAVGEPDPGQRLLGPAPALLARQPGVDQRQLDVVQRVGAGQQVEGLEHEADLAVADRGQLVVRELLDRGAVQAVGARGRLVEAADHVHQGGLAAARGTHDGHVLAAVDREIDAVERVHLLGAHVVDLGDLRELDQRHRGERATAGG